MRLRIPEVQAKRRFDRVLRLAQAGHRITLTRHGRPTAELGPVQCAGPVWAEASSGDQALPNTEGRITAAIATDDGEQIIEAMQQAAHSIGLRSCDRDELWEEGVVSIARSAVEVFGSPAEAARWLLQPAMGLNRQRPIEMIGAGDITEVTLFLGRLEYEVYT